jgi:Protein of unknown function (DUF3888)
LRKISVSILAICLMLNVMLYNYSIAVPAAPIQQLSNSNEALYKDKLIISLLSPYIGKEMDKQYNGFVPFDIGSIKLTDLKQDVDGFYHVKVEVKPYKGAHNFIGIDSITFKVNILGETQVEKFEHVK